MKKKSPDEFFIPRGNRSARAAGEGYWTVHKTAQINNRAGVEVGQATAQESAADQRREDEKAEPAHPPETESTTRSPKRTAPNAAADQHCHCPKRARVAAVPSTPAAAQNQQYYYCDACWTADFARPYYCPACWLAASADAPVAAEAGDDIARFRRAFEREGEQTQPVLDEILGGPAAAEPRAVWKIDQEPSIEAEEEKCSWALLRRYQQRPILRLDQLDGYQEFVSYTLNLDGCSSDGGIFGTKYVVDYAAVL